MSEKIQTENENITKDENEKETKSVDIENEEKQIVTETKVIQEDEIKTEEDVDLEVLKLSTEEIIQAEEDYKHKKELLESVLERSNIIEQKRILAEEQKIRSKEQSRRAAELQSMEEEVFKRNAMDFYGLMHKTRYVVRDTTTENPNAYKISDAPSGKPGEIMVFQSGDRVMIRPWNHEDYLLSLPYSHLRTNNPNMVPCRKGGPLKMGTIKTVFKQGPQEIRLKNGRRVKKAFVIEKKLKVSGRVPAQMKRGVVVPGTLSKRGSRSGGNR